MGNLLLYVVVYGVYIRLSCILLCIHGYSCVMVADCGGVVCSIVWLGCRLLFYNVCC